MIPNLKPDWKEEVRSHHSGYSGIWKKWDCDEVAGVGETIRFQVEKTLMRQVEHDLNSPVSAFMPLWYRTSAWKPLGLDFPVREQGWSLAWVSQRGGSHCETKNLMSLGPSGTATLLAPCYSSTLSPPPHIMTHSWFSLFFGEQGTLHSLCRWKD